MQGERQTEVSPAAMLNAKHLALASAGQGPQAPEPVLAIQLMLGGKDHSTRVHCENLSRYGVAIGSSLQLPLADIEALRVGGMVHDLGKIAIPDFILNKRAALTSEERLIVEAHPVLGEAMCAGIPRLRLALPIIRHNHERFDGSGYPDRLVGERIPLSARIVHILDVFDALTSVRPYKAAWGIDHALRTMQGEADRNWLDRRLFREFARLVRQSAWTQLSTLSSAR
jgi:putative two-component system response regulator